MENNVTSTGILAKVNNRLSGKHIAWIIISLKIFIICYLLYLVVIGYQNHILHFDSTLLQFVFVGFIAQIVDGALGMAYGVSCTTLLLNLGIPAKFASASVHTSEIFLHSMSQLDIVQRVCRIGR